MTKDCIGAVNGKIGEAVETSIGIIHEKLDVVTRNIGVAAKERAGVAWGIDPEELQKIKVTFNKCKPTLTSNDHGWFSTWISWEIQLGLPEIKKNQSSHSRL